MADFNKKTGYEKESQPSKESMPKAGREAYKEEEDWEEEEEEEEDEGLSFEREYGKQEEEIKKRFREGQ